MFLFSTRLVSHLGKKCITTNRIRDIDNDDDDNFKH